MAVSEVTMFLPCNEGVGDKAFNTAGPGTKFVPLNATTSWANYNPTTRPSFRVLNNTVALDCDAINETPYNVFGNAENPAPWQAMTVALVRFNGNVIASLFEPGEDPSSHSYGKAAGQINFSSGDRSFYSVSTGTATRIFGVACFTEPVSTETPQDGPIFPKVNYRDVYCVVEYNVNTGAIISEVAFDAVSLNPDGPNRGYGQDGGYPQENFDLFCAGAGSSYEIYGGLHIRVTDGYRPAAAEDAATLLATAKGTFADWLAGNKVYSPLYEQAIVSPGRQQRRIPYAMPVRFRRFGRR